MCFLNLKTLYTFGTGTRNLTPDHLSQRNENLCPHKNVYKNAHRSFICNSQKLETTLLQVELRHSKVNILKSYPKYLGM